MSQLDYTHLVPQGMLEQVPSELDYHQNDRRFLIHFGSVVLVSGMSVSAAYALILSNYGVWSIPFFMLFAACMYGLFIVDLGREKQSVAIDNRHANYYQIAFILTEISQNIHIDQVKVQKGGTFIQGDTPIPAASVEVLPINSTYQLALKIAQIGIEAWQAEDKRPKKKPISALEIKEKLGVGSEAWQDAIGLIGDAQVMYEPETRAWKLLVNSTEEAQVRLDKHLRAMGYHTYTKDDKLMWGKYAVLTK